MGSTSDDKVTWRRYIRDAIIGRNSKSVPTAMLSVIFTVQMFNTMTNTSVMSYSPQLIKNFGYSEIDTGYYAGILCATIYFSRIVFCIQWGLFSDWKGMKFTFMITTFGLSLSTLAFGFIFNYYWALCARFCQGIFCGVIVSSKSIILTYCDETTAAFGITLLGAGFAMGMVLGPSIASFMVFPVQQYPRIFSKDSIFSTFPVLLPNLLISIGLFVCLIFIKIYIPDDNINKKERPESDTINATGSFDESQRLFESNDIEQVKKKSSLIVKRMKFSNLGILMRSTECWKVCILFALHGILSYGYNEIFPVFLATIRKYHGLGFQVYDIGCILLISAAFQFVLQIIIIPPLFNRLGPVKYQIIVNLSQSLFYSLLPATALLSEKFSIWICIVALSVMIRLGNEAFFINANIMLKDSISPNILGSANGLSMSVSSIGSAIGTTSLGAAYSWSLTNIKHVTDNHNPLGFPFNQFFTFLIMSALSIITAVYVIKLWYWNKKSIRERILET